jgi:hypothetical protein
VCSTVSTVTAPFKITTTSAARAAPPTPDISSTSRYAVVPFPRPLHFDTLRWFDIDCADGYLSRLPSQAFGHWRTTSPVPQEAKVRAWPSSRQHPYRHQAHPRSPGPRGQQEAPCLEIRLWQFLVAQRRRRKEDKNHRCTALLPLPADILLICVL